MEPFSMRVLLLILLLIFFKCYAIMSIARLFTVFMTLKTSFQNISKRSHRNCSNFDTIEAA